MSTYVVDVDLLEVTSSVSIPFYFLSLPEGETINANFIYNYYTRDEGISEVTSLDAIDATSDQYDFVSENWENGTLPRQVNLFFSCSNPYGTATLDTGVIEQALSGSSIIYEDAPFDTRFSSVLVHDTSVDEKLYTSANSLFLPGASGASLTTNSFLSSARLQSSGYRFSKAQAREQVVALYEDNVKSLNLGISINTLFIADILKTCTTWQASAFVDEFSAAIPSAQDAQDKERSQVVPNIFTISENEIDISIVPIETKNYTTSYFSTSGLDLTTKRVGFLIEKYGEQLNSTTLRYPDIIIEDPDTTSFVDESVRYGGVYSYKIRTLYRVYLVSEIRSSVTGEILGYTVSALLVASTGAFTTTQCVETTPPQPPENISFQQTLDGLYIRWNFPINPQKDIKRFQVFRRQSVDDPFELIREIDFDLTILPYTSGEVVPEQLTSKYKGPVKHFIDSDFSGLKSDFIYALACIDAHGYSSGYSEQFRVRFDIITGKLLISRVSTSGAPKPFPNVKLEGDFFSDIVTDSGHSRMRIYFDPEYSDISRSGESLSLISSTSTGEATYRISMTEINLGKSQTVDIVVAEPRVTVSGIPVSLAKFYTAD